MGSEEWVYGLNPVFEAVRAGRNVSVIYVSYARRERVWNVTKEAEERGIPVKGVEPDFFDRKFPKGHQGIAAKVFRRSYISFEDLLQVPEKSKEIPLFVILDSVEDPRNFGAILRSVDAAGAHGVVIQSYRSVSLGPEVSKSSAGAVEYVPVSMVTNIKHAMREMRDRGIIIIGAEANGSSSVWGSDLSVPLALVVGSEGKGIRRTVRENCDRMVRLPMRGRVNSLNVSVATGIILFEALRQRYWKNR